MHVDYLRKNLAPRGKHLHERLVDYARLFLKYNIDAPEEYIHKEVQIGKDEGNGTMQIVDIALIPDGTYRDLPYKSIGIECGNLTGDAVEHLTYTMKHFDVVGWIPYPYMHYG
jgi:hypothetical protein